MNIEQWSGHNVPETVFHEAASWIAKLDSGNLPENQQVAFYSWLQAKADHQFAYLELSELWAKSACIKSMEDLVEKSSVVPFIGQLSKVAPQMETSQPLASPAWAYSLTIGLIFLGLSLPIIQHFV